MNKKSFPSISSMNPQTMANLNRMTFLMTISEITPQIYISGQMAANLEQVQKFGITYILVKYFVLYFQNEFFVFLKNVAVESSPIAYPKTIKLEKFDIIDFPTAPIGNYFNLLTDKIHAHLNANKQNKVLVHCMAGISRSNSFNIYFRFFFSIYISLRYNNCLCLFNALYEYDFT